jgi:hypothetical protein
MKPETRSPKGSTLDLWPLGIRYSDFVGSLALCVFGCLGLWVFGYLGLWVFGYLGISAFGIARQRRSWPFSRLAPFPIPPDQGSSTADGRALDVGAGPPCASMMAF